MINQSLFMGMSFFLGLIVLVFGADRIIDNMIKLMKKKGYSGGFLGLTVVSIGTSIPEITAHILASVDILVGRLPVGVASATVLGTNVGSDIVQQTLLISIVALLGYLKVTKTFLKRDFMVMIVAATVLFLFSLDGNISRVDGAVLLLGYLIYLTHLYKEENKVKKMRPKKVNTPAAYNWFIIFSGLFAVVIAAQVMLESTAFFVDKFDLGGSLIGVVLIGVGAALPELSTSVSAILKKQQNISLGTLVGSNITNPMFAIGLGGLISGYVVPKVVIWYDLPVKILTAVIILLFFWRTFGLQKREAIIMIVMYLAYIIARIYFFPTDVF